MNKRLIDARKLPCPQPVILTGKALDEAGEVTTIVDNEPARQNLERLAGSRGCEVSVEHKEDGIYVTLRRSGSAAVTQEPKLATGTVLLIASEMLGRGENEQLGALLMQSFLNTLDSLATRPETIIFINSGVKLVAQGSNVVEILQRLENQGIEILACGTCLSRFQLLDKVAVGQISNMQVIADTLMRAERTISL